MAFSSELPETSRERTAVRLAQAAGAAGGIDV